MRIFYVRTTSATNLSFMHVHELLTSSAVPTRGIPCRLGDGLRDGLRGWFAVALLAFTLLSAQGSDVIPGPTAELGYDNSVTWGKLDNGVRYALKANHQPQEKMSLRLCINAGSMLEDDLQMGLAHYLEHMAFNGTTHFPPGQLVSELQAIGLSFGADTNAHTGFDETMYKLDLPDTKKETILLGLRVLADFAGGMLLVDSEIERERGIILAEMRDRNTASFREYQALYRAMYPGKRIAQRFPIGVPETVNAADRPLLQRFYHDWYRPERIMVTAVGAMDAAAMTAMAAHIHDAFSGITAVGPQRAEPDYGTLTTQDLTVCVHHEPEAEGTTVSYVYVREQPRAADSKAQRQLETLRSVGERILSTRMQKWTAAHPEGALLQAEAYSYQWLDMYHVGVQAKIRQGQALDSVPLIEQFVRQFYEYGPLASEVQTVIAAMTNDIDEAVAKQQNRTNAQLAAELFRASKFDTAFLSPEQEQELWRAFLPGITAQTVHAAFRANWEKKQLFLAVTGAQQLGSDAEQQLRQALRTSEQISVAVPVENMVAAWGYAQSPAEPIINASEAAERKRRTELFTKRGITFDCIGPVDIVVKRTTYKPNEVLLQARFAITPTPYPAGWGEFIERSFLSGGLGKHPAETLADVLAGNSTRLSPPRVRDDEIAFNASCLPKDLETCLQRVIAHITDPGWRSEAEARSKAEWLDELAAVETNLDAQVARRFESLSVYDAPHRRAATKTEVEAINNQQVRPWFTQLLLTSPLQITIIGDINESAVLALARRYAALLKGKRTANTVHLGKTNELTLAQTQPLPAGVHRFAVMGTVRRALLRVAWPTTDFYDIKQTRRLGVLAQVVDEHMRLCIREELGDAYSPFAYRFASETFANFGYLVAQVGVAPEKSEEARRSILAIASELAQNGVKPDILQRVMTPIIKNLSAQRQQNQYWMNAVLDRVVQQPFRMEWAQDMVADYESITAEEISALADRYLDNEKTLQVIAVCEGKSP
jgi:zinc protease